MSSYNQQAAPIQGTGLAYSAPPAAVQPPAYAVTPPPGYPVNGTTPYTQQVPLETKQRGDGFWKGCAAALCCCCVLETCCE